MNITFIITNVIDNINLILSDLLPFIVKSLIGYCHFYYQLGYGLIFYIYLFRRFKAKKKGNWKNFYGNSVINWFLFNVSILNRNIISFVRNQFILIISTFKYLALVNASPNHFFKKFSKIYFFVTSNLTAYIWTPIFKKSSYISFLTFLKRFSKKK